MCLFGREKRENCNSEETQDPPFAKGAQSAAPRKEVAAGTQRGVNADRAGCGHRAHGDAGVEAVGVSFCWSWSRSCLARWPARL